MFHIVKLEGGYHRHEVDYYAKSYRPRSVPMVPLDCCFVIHGLVRHEPALRPQKTKNKRVHK